VTIHASISCEHPAFAGPDDADQRIIDGRGHAERFAQARDRAAVGFESEPPASASTFLREVVDTIEQAAGKVLRRKRHIN
jgi:hypothetical protein